MTKKILAAAIAAACAVALTAGPAHAGDGGRTTIVFSLEPNLVAPTSCADSLFGFALRIASLKGSPLGTGQTCIDTIDGCEPFAPFCRRTVAMKLLEVLPTESSFIQLGSGMVSAGSGAYAVAKGRVAGGGAGAFDEQLTFAGRLVYTAQLTGVR